MISLLHSYSAVFLSNFSLLYLCTWLLSTVTSVHLTTYQMRHPIFRFLTIFVVFWIHYDFCSIVLLSILYFSLTLVSSWYFTINFLSSVSLPSATFFLAIAYFSIPTPDAARVFRSSLFCSSLVMIYLICTFCILHSLFLFHSSLRLSLMSSSWLLRLIVHLFSRLMLYLVCLASSLALFILTYNVFIPCCALCSRSRCWSSYCSEPYPSLKLHIINWH
jgi:hypothetical protein